MEEILIALVVARELMKMLDAAAKKEGFTQEDIDKADKDRAGAIAKFTEAAGIE